MIEEYITSRKNPLCLHVRKLTTSRKYRRECGEFLGDGLKLLEEAIRWEAKLTTVILAEGIPVPTLKDGVRLVRVPTGVMEYLSPMETPQGAIFLCEIPDTAGRELDGSGYLVLDGLQDTGNVGAILRSADALGADGLILTGGCVDPWNWKTVRASMGACFRLPIWEMEDGLQEALETAKLPLYATALREDTQDIRVIDVRRCAVVIGSEGKGVSETILNLCEKTVKIPMRERCESLNAAAAATIVLWEMARGR